MVEHLLQFNLHFSSLLVSMYFCVCSEIFICDGKTLAMQYVAQDHHEVVRKLVQKPENQPIYPDGVKSFLHIYKTIVCTLTIVNTLPLL